MRKISKYFLNIVIIILACFMLVGCTSFFGDDSLQIESIRTETLEDGSTRVTITYTDEDRAPDVFVIPANNAGADGNGIKDIITEKIGAKTILRITFTDESRDDVIFELEDGVTIIGIDSFINEEDGTSYMIVYYSNGTQSNPISLPRGEAGNGISGYEIEVQEDGSTIITFHFTRTEDVTITIPAPQKGETGRGIRSIIATETEDNYVLIINYTDNTFDEVKFTRPQPNTWYSGSSEPSNSLGKNGDYYFDIAHNDIYMKQSGRWQMIIDFDSMDELPFAVTFNLNDSSDEPARMPSGALSTYYIKKGTYFSANGYGNIPVPTREGYQFIGWYSSKILTPTSDRFGDLTAVFSDLVLYAQWEKID